MFLKSNVENCGVLWPIQSPSQFERQMNLMMLFLPNLKIGTTFMLLTSTISYRGSSGLPCHVALGIHIKIDQNLLDIEPRIKSIHFQFLCLHLYFAGTIGRRRSIIERCWWHCSLCLIPWYSYVHKFHYGSSEWFWAYTGLLLRFLFPQVAIPSSLILLWLECLTILPQNILKLLVLSFILLMVSYVS